MPTNNRSNTETSHLTFLTKLGTKVSTLIWLIIATIIACIVLDVNYLNPTCKNSQEESSLPCIASPIIVNVYSSLVATIVTILGIERILSNETLKKFEEMLDERETKKSVQKLEEHKKKIVEAIESKSSGDELCLLGLYQEIRTLRDDVKMAELTRKLRHNCNFKILLLHPNSSLLTCIKEMGDVITSEQIENDLIGFIRKLTQTLKDENAIKGSIDIRLHKDIFSSMGYFKGNHKEIIWMHFNPDDYSHPGFEITDSNLKNAVNDHFKLLWNQSKSLFKFNSENLCNKQYSEEDIKNLINPVKSLPSGNVQSVNENK